MANTYEDDVTYKVDLSGPLPKVEPSTLQRFVGMAAASPSSPLPKTLDDEVVGEQQPRQKRKTPVQRTRSAKRAT